MVFNWFQMTVRLTIADFVYMLTTNQRVILQPVNLTIWTTLSSHATSSSDLLNLVAVYTSDQWLTFQRLLHEHTKFCTNQTILSKYITCHKSPVILSFTRIACGVEPYCWVCWVITCFNYTDWLDVFVYCLMCLLSDVTTAAQQSTYYVLIAHYV